MRTAHAHCPCWRSLAMRADQATERAGGGSRPIALTSRGNAAAGLWRHVAEEALLLERVFVRTHTAYIHQLARAQVTLARGMTAHDEEQGRRRGDRGDRGRRRRSSHGGRYRGHIGLRRQGLRHEDGFPLHGGVQALCEPFLRLATRPLKAFPPLLAGVGREHYNGYHEPDQIGEPRKQIPPLGAATRVRNVSHDSTFLQHLPCSTWYSIIP